MTDDPKPAQPAPAPPQPRAARGPKPPAGTPWAHQPGCTNPANAQGLEDWNCPCGPEVIKG